MKTSILLAGAAVVALATGIGTARAASPTLIYSGGSTLAAKVYRDIFNCYAAPASTITTGTPVPNGVFVSSATLTDYPAGASIAYPTSLPTNATGAFLCTKGAGENAVVLYEPVGSGAGQGAWQAANPNGNSTLGYKSWGTPATSNSIAYLDAAANVNQITTPYPEIQFSGSDAYLNSTQIANAQASVGGEAVFQLPTFATPITLPVGGKQNVKLTSADVCNLFAGVTNKSAAGVTFSELVVRSDSSGTSFILADWLAQNCSASLNFNSSYGFPSTTPSWMAVSLLNNPTQKNALTIVPESGSGGVANTVASTANALGYVSPDYDYPIVTTSTAYSAYVNGEQPTVANVKSHLTHASYPTSYNVETIGQVLNDSLVAKTNTSGYPIVGYTFWETYSCYSTSLAGGLIGGPAQGKQVLALANYLYATSNTSVENILTGQGFVQAGTAVTNLLKGAGGPLNATGGIQNSSCPST